MSDTPEDLRTIGHLAEPTQVIGDIGVRPFPYCNADDTKTPRTDAEHDKTLTQAYEYAGAESEAWEFARTLERELAVTLEAKRRLIGLYEDLTLIAERPLPFSRLF